MSSVSSYVVHFFPLASLTLLLRWALSPVLQKLAKTYPKCWPKRLRCQVSEWKFFKTMNCMGTFIQVGFATLSALSLQPLMCYQHPNGLYSVLKYPSTFCGHSEQVIMIAIGMVLMTIFVLGFFAACSLAAWKMPTWSLEKNHRWVQSFTFLTGKFRLDAWYFGTPLLLRGLGLGVTVALGTDRPEVQISLASVVILLYLCTLVRVWPWKARVLNVADTALSAGMLLLVRQNSHAASSDESFREVFSALIIVLLFGSTAFMLMLCVWALARSRCGGDAGTSLLNLGFRSSAEMVSRALKDCAEGLLEMEAEQLKEKLGKMNTYDLAALQATITLTSIELLSSSDWHFNARVSLQAISHGGFVRSRSFEPQAPAPPTPSDHANDAPGDVSEEDSEDMANRKIGLVDDQPTQSEMM
ncbi:unnamed protein product [Durusdinium trenchii]|uniref:TRP C-terminal domain-containing protein n=1 Tax=Durusdinium trenchii TaxID=1381693 RepID=A0ABP0QIP5_9DINO